MFGSYCSCNIIVLLNMLVAMMSNSYQIIFERSDTEWKFSRSKLWISYFDAGSTVPVPFNLIPAPKSIFRFLCCRKNVSKVFTEDEKTDAETRYNNVMKYIIRRYITNEQRKSEDFSITEDDINEVRQDINSFKFELLDILKKNNWVVPNQKRGNGVLGRKSKNMERQIQKGFQITKIEGIMEAFFGSSIDMKDVKPKDLFKKIARAAANKDKSKDWRTRESIKRSSIKRDQIGSTQASIKRQQNSLKRSMLNRKASQAEINIMLTRLNSEELVAFNPLLTDQTPATRRAYAIFKSALKQYNDDYDKNANAAEGKASQPESSDPTQRNLKNAKTARDSIKKLVLEKKRSVDNTSEPPQSAVNKSVAELEKVLDEDKSVSKSEEKAENDRPKTPAVSERQPSPKTAPVKSPEKVIDEKPKLAEKIATPKPSPAKPPPETEVKEKKSPKKDIEEKAPELKGVDNLAFEKEELVVKVTPPSVQNTLESESKVEKKMETSSAKVKSESEPSKKIESADKKDDAKQSNNEKKEIPDDEICFDPEGKSAISGQRRTGWI